MADLELVVARLDEGHATPAEPFGGLTHGPPGAPARPAVSWRALRSGQGVLSVVCGYGEGDHGETGIAMAMDG